ncbi:hypothetical protein N781_09205 [Pontibacillus halophilus JSM 076056 = DSM 19796]|uniref:YtzH-like protein n=1 Tax=Pontibacillus halophilus JSM 076056 = DSM 19796 TaxID=1385510 RepID=A0A0A5GDY9_9BACI|nr:YtzH-like family protein [Pontibacillus halophilus]KGX89418.1 hypothetical protein N781_09205 [Pontibacillus halophilus JSM 076056 = DSM 19796]
MPLTSKDQLHILYDLLSEQSEVCQGSISECQQIQRLVHSLLSKEDVTNKEVLDLLPDIYHYGRQGELAEDLSQHISNHTTHLQQWTNSIQASNDS